MNEERKACSEMKDVLVKCGKKGIVCCTECKDSDVCRGRCYFTLVNDCKIGKYEKK